MLAFVYLTLNVTKMNRKSLVDLRKFQTGLVEELGRRIERRDREREREREREGLMNYLRGSRIRFAVGQIKLYIYTSLQATTGLLSGFCLAKEPFPGTIPPRASPQARTRRPLRTSFNEENTNLLSQIYISLYIYLYGKGGTELSV